MQNLFVRPLLALAIVALGACSAPLEAPQLPAPPKRVDSNIYSFSTEGYTVPWTLEVWNPTKSTLKATYTQSSPGGIEGSFEWRVRGDGRCLGLKFRGDATALVITDRDVVRLQVDGVSKAYGVIKRRPSARDPRLSDYEAGDPFLDLMTEAVIKNYSLQDVALIARDVAQTYGHPALTYNVANFPLTGGSIQKQVGSVSDSGQFLEGLAKSLGPNWSTGVDADGNLFLRQPSGTLALDYATTGFDDLPIDSTDIVTKAQVVVFTGQEVPQAAAETSYILSSRPIVLTHTDALHSTYNATKPPVAFTGSEAFDAGAISPAIQPASFGFSNTTNLFDNDAATFTDNISGGGYLEADLSSSSKVYGFELIYDVAGNANSQVTFQIERYELPSNTLRDFVAWRLQPTDKKIQRFIIPFTDATDGLAPSNVLTKIKIFAYGVSASPPASIAKFYQLRALYLSPAVTTYAQSLIKLPYTTPGEVTLYPPNLTTGYAAFATITGAPINLTVQNTPIAMYEGTLSVDTKREVIRFGSPTGDGEATAQLQVIQRQDQIAQQQTQSLLLRR